MAAKKSEFFTGTRFICSSGALPSGMFWQPMDVIGPDKAIHQDQKMMPRNPGEFISNFFWGPITCPQEIQVLDVTRNRFLFHSFAAIGANNLDGMLEFANTYGPLEKISDDAAWGAANMLSRWRTEIRAMVSCINLWQLSVDGDEELLADEVEFVASSVDQPLHMSNELTAKEKALSLITSFANGRLVDTSALIITVRGRLQVATELQTLLSALWMQLLAHIETGELLCFCENCNGPLSLDGNHRTDRQFCSDKCRQKARRQKPR